MISYNSKLTFPQVIVLERKHDKIYYVANSIEDIKDIAFSIVKTWKKDGELDFLSEDLLPKIDLLNEEKAKMTPWQYSPNSKLDQIDFILSNVEHYIAGETPEVLKTFFKENEKYKEKWDNLDYWKTKMVVIVNKYSEGEYMNVYNETPQKFK